MASETPEKTATFTDRAAAFWKERGGRLTVVREMICRCAGETDAAFDAQSLWTDVRKLDRGISIASVYRTISDLTEAGLLNEINSSREEKSYVVSDAAAIPTGHLICKDCQRIFPLNDNCIGLREGPLLKNLGFQAGGMHLQIEAACESLRRCGTCEKPPA